MIIAQGWDAHCHLLDPRIEGLRADFISGAHEKGICNFWLGGVSPEDWPKQIQFKREVGPEVRIVTSFGLHPWWVVEQARSQVSADGKSEIPVSVLKALHELQAQIGSADSLGELGIDFHPRQFIDLSQVQAEAAKRVQEFAFREQLVIASRAKKPLVLHIVRAHRQAIAILKNHHAIHGPLSGIVHSFGADLQIARHYLALGLTLSISASTFKETHAALQTQKAIQALDLSNIVIETDSPDQGLPFTSNDNEPVHVLQVAQAVAKIKSTTAQKVLEQSSVNLIKILGI